MYFRKKVAVLFCLAGLILPGLAWAHPEAAVHKWNIEGIGQAEAPVGLAITPFTNVMEAVFSYAQAQMEREAEAKNRGVNPLELQKYRDMLEEVKQFARENRLQGYQLALREKDAYDIAMAVSVRLPQEVLPFLSHVETLADDPKGQGEAVKIGEETVNAYGDGKDGLPEFQFEVLAYEPIKTMRDDDLKIMSVSGSIAFTMFEIITPYAFKAYLVQDGQDSYVLFLNTHPAGRQKWNAIMDQMLIHLKPIDSVSKVSSSFLLEENRAGFGGGGWK